MNKKSAHLYLIWGTLFVCLFYPFSITKAQLIINEVVASNDGSLRDDDGEYPDWIELYNSGNEVVNLEGYGISDDPEEPFQFTLPAVDVDAGAYFILYASDKNRNGLNAYWETVIREGDNTRFVTSETQVGDGWVDLAFDDSGWQTGAFGIGYGDDDDATETNSGILSVFTRTEFTVEDPSDVTSIRLHIDFDDGYVAYLNGQEISRENMSGDSPFPQNATATIYTEPKLSYGEVLGGINADEFVSLLREGSNTLAIQVHNYNTGSSDITLIPFLSLGYLSPPSDSRGVAEETQLQTEQIAYPHLNFKLSADGEDVILTKPDGETADELIFPELNSDESYGRGEDGTGTYIFTESTPLAANTTQGYSARLEKPEVTLPGGFYNQAVQVQLQDTEQAGNTYYTLDGSDPTTDSQVIGTEGLNLDETTVLKLRTLEDGKLSSEVEVQTYFFGADHTLPVVSISTNPENFFDDEIGIYVRGTNGIDLNCSEGPANWNQDWERPVHVELFEGDGERAFSSGAGTKIFGGCSRVNPAKSLAIYFRSDYGNSELEYKLFEEKDIDTFQAFVLRNSGNDFTSQGHSMIRDGLMKTLLEGSEIDYQAFRPSVVYINGEYYGIHNIREKVNEHFIESNSNADSDNIDLLENDRGVIHGSAENYNEFLDVLSAANMQNEEEYLKAEAFIDTENYIDYMAAEIYYANTDWPGNNLKYWRDRSEGGKWRWIMYDTDFGFNLSYGGHYDHNTLAFALNPNGSSWPNPSWSTFVFRNMTESSVFVRKFVNRMSDYMNTVFQPEHVNTVIDSLTGIITPEIYTHLERFGNSASGWENDIEELRSFAENRPGYMAEFIKAEFGFSDPVSTTVDVSNPEYGNVKISRITPSSYPWSGDYFGGNQVEVSATAKTGYQFTSWSGASTSTEENILINAGESVTANFESITSASSDIVINEIMYNALEEEDSEDWVEFYNAADVSVDISNWVLKDEDDDHEFIFPEGTQMAAGSYLVVVQNEEAFNTYYPNVEPLFGEMDFGLSGGSDDVRLFDDEGNLVDMLTYDDEDPWDPEADGTGFSLELINPALDNSLAENWGASSQQKGTPGEANSILTSKSEEQAIPSAISLNQNYPNPFNPGTNISFELPADTRIKLTIFDMLGRQVAELENGFRRAGAYQVYWDASSQASGVYIYRLQAGEEVFTRKMLLIK